MKPLDLIKTESIKRSSGIYLIICSSNNRCYVGKSKNIYRRCVSHREKLRKGEHHNIHLQRSWSKYGAKDFIFAAAEYCDEQFLGQKEIDWLLKFEEDTLFNTGAVGGYQATKNSPIRSEAQKKKWEKPGFRENMSNKLKGRIMDKEWRRKIGEAGKGRKHSPETIEKMVALKRGRPISLKNKLNLIPSRKRKFTNIQADEIRKEFIEGYSLGTLKEKYNTTIHVIFNIVRGRSYVLDCNKNLIEDCKIFNRSTEICPK